MNSVDYSKLSVAQLAVLIEKDWRNVYFGAKPYLAAMYSLNTVNDSYMHDSGRSIVNYFLGNAGTWKGQVAREIKAELRKRIK